MLIRDGRTHWVEHPNPEEPMLEDKDYATDEDPGPRPLARIDLVRCDDDTWHGTLYQPGENPRTATGQTPDAVAKRLREFLPEPRKE